MSRNEYEEIRKMKFALMRRFLDQAKSYKKMGLIYEMSLMIDSMKDIRLQMENLGY